MNRLTGTILETGVIRPALFCAGAIGLGVLIAGVQGWVRLAFSEDVGVEIEDGEDGLPSGLPWMPDVRGTA